MKNKLEAAWQFRNITKEIISLSLKTEYQKVNLLIEERQQYIEKINGINEEIEKAEELSKNFTEPDEIKRLKNEIREVFREIAEMDNLIRKNINSELKNLKGILSQPETRTKLVNIKA